MASLTVTPEDVGANREVVLTGEDWGEDPVSISVQNSPVSAIVLTPDEDGAITSVGAFTLIPDKGGIWNISGVNEENEVAVAFRVWSG